MRRRVDSELVVGQALSRETAEVKQGFEICLAACESVLGGPNALALVSMPTPPADPEERFWHGWLARAASGRIDLAALAAELEVLPAAPVLASPPMPTPSTSLAAGALAAGAATSTGGPSSRPSPTKEAEDLRRDLLTRAQIESYARRLQVGVQADPGNLEAWRELQLIQVAYLKDAHAALQVIEGALVHFPDDMDFQRWREIVRLWIARNIQREVE